VWALLDYGFRVVISERFGDIFRNNATKSGLLPVQLPAAAVASLQDLCEADPSAEMLVDLGARTVAAPADSPAVAASFPLDDYTRWRLMEGLDDISLTLRHASEITGYERGRAAWLPVA
jgi:3-isopropylmalate/(R)-2-methylmalate dehydratase small subunit